MLGRDWSTSSGLNDGKYDYDEPKRLFPPSPPGFDSNYQHFQTRNELDLRSPKPRLPNPFTPQYKKQESRSVPLPELVNRATGLKGNNLTNLAGLSEFSQEQVDKFRDAFDQANATHSGVLNLTEFRACLRTFGLIQLTNLNVKELLDSVDRGGSKMLSFMDFMHMWQRAAETEHTLPFCNELYQALRHANLMPLKAVPVPFEHAKNWFETKTCELAQEAFVRRQQRLISRAKQDTTQSNSRTSNFRSMSQLNSPQISAYSPRPLSNRDSYTQRQTSQTPMDPRQSFSDFGRNRLGSSSDVCNFRRPNSYTQNDWRYPS